MQSSVEKRVPEKENEGLEDEEKIHLEIEEKRSTILPTTINIQ